MAVSARAQVSLEVKETSSEGGGGAQDRYSANVTTQFVDVAGALGATKQWNDQRTNATTTESLDLAGGVTNRFGNVQTFAKVKGFWVYHRGTTGTLTVGGGSTPFVGAFTGTIILHAGGKLLLVDETSGGWTVTAATGDLLQVVGSASILYEICIWGE